METEPEWEYVNSEIQQITLPEVNEWHIGLKKQGTWKWVSGKPLTIKKWQRYEPSGDGNAAVMSKDYPRGSQGLFNDLSGQYPKPYICEMPSGKIKKQVKTIVVVRKYIYILILLLRPVPIFLLLVWVTIITILQSEKMTNRNLSHQKNPVVDPIYCKKIDFLNCNKMYNFLIWGMPNFEIFLRLPVNVAFLMCYVEMPSTRIDLSMLYQIVIKNTWWHLNR